MLPDIMVAPNGARKTKADHPALPITLTEIVATAKECYACGAGGLHLHVRDENGRHSLDTGRYREALAELHGAVPDMTLQITTEAVGQYTPAQQRQVVRDVQPRHVSISLAEMTADGDTDAASRFYRDCAGAGVIVQHILYGQDDLLHMDHLLQTGQVQADGMHLLFVLGRYAEGQQSHPDDLRPFTTWLGTLSAEADWAVCAFGAAETACLTEALKIGGKVRVGFENSVLNGDGSQAASNAERVAEISQIADQLRARG